MWGYHLSRGDYWEFAAPESYYSHKGSLSSTSAGGGQPHENRPPYYALCYIMRVK
jgi:microcystin-dependent protein